MYSGYEYCYGVWGVFTNLYIALDITMIPRIALLLNMFFFFDVIDLYY